jgi:putative oxidoreductase
MSLWARLCALVVGAVFLVAAWGKIADPPGFAQALFHYHLVPELLRHPMALALPWLELGCGCALVWSAVWGRPSTGAAWWTLGLLGVFVIALGINLWRGNPVDCGCFGTSAPRPAAEVLASMRWTILRDLGLVVLMGPLLRKAR